jgi:hypothetical protein
VDLLSSAVLAIVCFAQCNGTDSSHPPALESSSDPLPGSLSSSQAVAELDSGIATPSAIEALLASLQVAVSTNASAYGQVDLEDIDDLLTYSLLRAQSPGGRGNASAQCVRSALAAGFSATQSGALCIEVIEDSAACASRAIGAGFDRDSAVSLCTRRGSIATSDCASATLATLGGMHDNAVAVCTDRDGETTPACTSAALAGGFTHDQATSLCAHRGSTLTATCATTAAGLGFARADAVTLCAARGADETTSCAKAALDGGFSRAQAVRLCAGRGQKANATCAINVVQTNLTRDQAVDVCRRQSTEDAALVQGVVAP